MIYLDTSVALAQLLGEDRAPPDRLWTEPLVASRLVEYESWIRIQSMGLTGSHAEPLRLLLGRVAFLELASPVLSRALEPFPSPVRTLDALHLATVEFLRSRDQPVKLATYGERMRRAARRMRIPLFELP